MEYYTQIFYIVNMKLRKFSTANLEGVVYMNLKEKIVALCKERGITIRELERRAGLKERTIQHWDESEPSGQKLYSVAQVLDVPVEELLSVYSPELERVANVLKMKKQLDETTELQEELQILRDNPETRTLLHSSKNLTAEQLRAVADMIRHMKGNNADDY